TLFLYERGILATPLLYLSAYFDRDRQRYYDELFRMSLNCDWQAWLSYFLEGVAEQAHDALTRIRRVRAIQDSYRQALQERGETSNGFRLLDELLSNPIMTASFAAKLTGLSVAGVRRILDRFVDAGIVTLYAGVYPHLYIAQELLSEIDPAVTWS
ncbi:MAG: winged helix-turn-helix transcriptional regulator, partial [Chloroflexi bacterium]|nr:winged helix-turn-helix transcriptional regulator [Chloroflexota bacterium]